MSIIKNKNIFLFYRKQAANYINEIKNTSFKNGIELHTLLYPYILCKYSLLGDCEDIYDLNTLAEMSVAKTIRLTKTDAFKADSSASCEGTTSAMNKKVLLLMALQKELGISFPREITADLTDTKKISDAVYQQMQACTGRNRGVPAEGIC